MNVRIEWAIAALLGVAAGDAAAQPQVAGRSLVQRPRASPGAGADWKGGAALSPGGPAAVFPQEFRTVDGTGNNLQDPQMGAAETALLRVFPPAYADGRQAPAGVGRRSPRAISNAVAAQVGSIPNARGASDFLWMWGQFLDHDLDETPIAAPAEAFDIRVPQGDAWFDPAGTGVVSIPLDRSGYDVVQGVRQQVNNITAWIDGSNVYGSDAERALALRTLDGTGRLRTSAGDLLPFNDHGLPNAPSPSATYFLAGDIRANEQVALTAMHTLFVREHNFWARRLAGAGMTDGDAIYERARAIVVAELQAITYREFLPVLLGPGALRPYHGYRSDVDASIANAFAAAGYRVGHTMLSPQLLRVQADGSPHPAGHLPLAQAFFDPSLVTALGIEPYLRGLSRQAAQEIDPYVVDGVRNFLFGPPGSGGFDLVSLNIQRGRDHGLPAYNDLRQALGRPRAQGFGDVSPDPEVRARLAQAYAHVDDVDAWVGLLSEPHAPGALVGRTLRALLADQFERLRDGDRFWYRAYLGERLADLIETQTLAAVIRRNTDIGAELQDDVFHVVP